MLTGSAGSARRLLATQLAPKRKQAPKTSSRSFSSERCQEECCEESCQEEENLRDMCPPRCPPGPRGCPGMPPPVRDYCCKDPPPPPCCVCPHSREPQAKGCANCKPPPVPPPCCPRPEHHRGPHDGSPSPYAKWIIAALGGAAAVGLAAYAASNLGGENRPPEDCPDEVEKFDPCDPCGCEKM